METQHITQNFLQRAAIGRNKKLGALYDARTDQFVPGILFRSPQIMLKDVPSESIDWAFEDSQIDKFKKTNIARDQKLSILLGDSPVEGSGKFFTDIVNNRTVRATLKYVFPTKREQCDPLDAERNDSLLASEATHVVYGITWGVCIYITFELAKLAKLTKKEANEDAQNRLQSLLETIIIETQKETHEKLDPFHQFEMKIFSDILIPGKIPTTVDDIPVFLQQISELIKNVNQGNGVPIEYELFPLSRFHPQNTIQKWKEEDVRTLIGMGQFISRFNPWKEVDILFEKIEKIRLDFQSFQTACEKVKEILPEKLIQEMEKEDLKIKILEAKFKKEIMDGVLIWRGENNNAKLKSALESIWDNFQFSNPRAFLENWEFMRQRLGVFEFFKNKGVVLLTLSSYQFIMFQSQYEKVFAFLYCEDDKQQLYTNLAWFKVLVEEKNPKNWFILIDVGAESQEPSKIRSCINYYRQGVLVCNDYASTDFILWDNTAERVERNKSLDVKQLKMPCPNSLQSRSCKNIEKEWVCENCQQKIEIDKEYILSCHCFRYRLNKARFKCSDPKHGSEFVAFDERLMESLFPREIPFPMGSSVFGEDFSSTSQRMFNEIVNEKMKWLKEGRGTQVWEDKDKYEGDWKNDQRDGEGKQKWANGDIYEGDWEEDKRTGGGKLIWANGDFYEGGWKDDKRTGGGKLVCKNGDTYEGDWKDDKREGGGTQIWTNGDRYSGDWKNDQRHGGGKFTKANGDVYEGGWVNDKPIGQGISYNLNCTDHSLE